MGHQRRLIREGWFMASLKWMFFFMCFAGVLSACEDTQDFPHFHSSMYGKAALHNVQIAEMHFRHSNFKEARVFFEIAQQQCRLMTFSMPPLEFRIEVGLLFAELLENPDLFLEKNIYVNRLRLLMREDHQFR